MPELKFEKNFVTEDLMPPLPSHVINLIQNQQKEGKDIDRTMMFGINDSIAKGSFFSGCEWIWGLKDGKPFSIENQHHHEFDEIIGLIGSKKENPRELNGKVEFWMEDEQYLITKSSLIFIPKGVRHCPLTFRQVDSPIFLYEAGNDTFYERIK